MAVLDYVFGTSFRKISKKLSIAFEPISKPTVLDCVRAFTSRIAIAIEPKRDVIAVDETCLLIQGREVWLWAAIDVVTKELIGYHVSLSRAGIECLSFISRVMRICTNKPLVLVDGGPWYNWPLQHFGLTKQRMTFSVRSHIEVISNLLKTGPRWFQTISEQTRE